MCFIIIYYIVRILYLNLLSKLYKKTDSGVALSPSSCPLLLVGHHFIFLGFTLSVSFYEKSIHTDKCIHFPCFCSFLTESTAYYSYTYCLTPCSFLLTVYSAGDSRSVCKDISLVLFMSDWIILSMWLCNGHFGLCCCVLLMVYLEGIFVEVGVWGQRVNVSVSSPRKWQ